MSTAYFAASWVQSTGTYFYEAATFPFFSVARHLAALIDLLALRLWGSAGTLCRVIMASVQEKANVASRRLVPPPEGLACVLAIGAAFPRAPQSLILIYVLVQTCAIHRWTFASESRKAISTVNCLFLFSCLAHCRWKSYFWPDLIGNAGDTSRFDKCHTFVAPELVLHHPELPTSSDASLSTRCYTVNSISF